MQVVPGIVNTAALWNVGQRSGTVIITVLYFILFGKMEGFLFLCSLIIGPVMPLLSEDVITS
jgi:hypothetical protein